MGTPVYKTKVFTGAASADREVVAAVTGKKIAVHAAHFKTDATGGTFRLEDGAGGTALTGLYILPAAGEVALQFSPVPWCITTAATALSAEVGAGAMVGTLIYSEID